MTRHCVCLLLLLLSLPCLAQPPVPEVTATACPAPVKVDGLLSEECWQQAQALGDFHVLGQENETSEAGQSGDHESEGNERRRR